jgi:hypothetical protein
MVEYKFNTSCSITKTSLTLCSDLIRCMYNFTAVTGAGIRNCSELCPFKHASVQLEGLGEVRGSMPVTTWHTDIFKQK